MALGKSRTSNTRSKETSEVANSTRMFESEDSGRYRRVRYAERATIVPTVREPWITSTAPTQKTTAVPIAPTTPRNILNQRPMVACLIDRSRTFAACPAKRSSSSSVRPNSFTRSAPETLSVSCMMEFMSAPSSI